MEASEAVSSNSLLPFRLPNQYIFLLCGTVEVKVEWFRLRSPAPLSSTLSPICLYTEDDDPQVALTVTGWGKTSTTRENLFLLIYTIISLKRNELREHGHIVF